MKRTTQPKPYWEMTAEELAEATKEFDKPIPLSKTRPLTKEQRRRWERMKQGPSVSIFVSRGSKKAGKIVTPAKKRRPKLG
jgi:hypothetical protein